MGGVDYTPAQLKTVAAMRSLSRSQDTARTPTQQNCRYASDPHLSRYGL